MKIHGKTVHRGQLIIISALVIAVLFVGLALVVNSAIYTENLSTRSNSHSEDALSATTTTFETITTYLERVNTRHNTSYDDLTQNYTQLTSDFQNAQSNTYAKRGAAFEMTTLDQTNGTHLRQANQSRAFTNASGNPSDWRVATGVGGISDYMMVVNRDDLYTDSGGSGLLSNASTVSLTDEDGDTWELHIYETTANEVAVKPVVDGTEKSACEVGATEVEIDLVAGTVGGAPCSTLVFAEGLEGPLDIEYHNPDEIAGSYSLRVDVVIDPATSDHYVERGAGSPTATPNIYATTPTMTYATSDISYTATKRMVAGEPAYAD
jgi:hypothetical protein